MVTRLLGSVKHQYNILPARRGLHNPSSTEKGNTAIGHRRPGSGGSQRVQVSRSNRLDAAAQEQASERRPDSLGAGTEGLRASLASSLLRAKGAVVVTAGR